jgi:hypothetical protein
MRSPQITVITFFAALSFSAYAGLGSEGEVRGVVKAFDQDTMVLIINGAPRSFPRSDLKKGETLKSGKTVTAIVHFGKNRP